MEITGRCLNCNEPFRQASDSACINCKNSLFPNQLAQMFEQCSVCGCNHLYQQKDFNRRIGIGLIAAGIVLAYWTYGLSLLTVAVLDFIIRRKVGDVGICYACKTEYRGSEVGKLPEFKLVLHDHYRNKKGRAVTTARP